MTEISAYSSSYYDYAEQRKNMFKSADTDSDGQLTIEEFSAAKPANAPAGGPSSSEIFASLDADEDGYLSEREVESGKTPPPPPPGPPPSDSSSDETSLLSTDMLSQILQALEESLSDTYSISESDDEDTTTTEAKKVDSESEDDSETSDIEEDILSLIQEELENYRGLANPFMQAVQAYGAQSAPQAQILADG